MRMYHIKLEERLEKTKLFVILYCYLTLEHPFKLANDFHLCARFSFKNTPETFLEFYFRFFWTTRHIIRSVKHFLLGIVLASKQKIRSILDTIM